MISFGTRERFEQRRRPIAVGDGTFHKGEWMECGEDPGLSPTVFLAEQPADFVLTPHFHRQNQFQLFVGGSGSLGPQALDPVTVHYAGAYTGYGPVVAGPQGLQYFTIRPVFDTGLIPAAQAREKMVRGPKRHAQVSLGPVARADQLAALPQPESWFALAAERGLAVQRLRLPAHTDWRIEGVEASIGQFIFVLTGSAVLAGRPLGEWESAWVGTGDAAGVTAAEGGAELIALHVPPTEPEYRQPG